MSTIFENKKWHKIYEKSIGGNEELIAPPILNSFEESKFNQSVSWSKDKKISR